MRLAPTMAACAFAGRAGAALELVVETKAALDATLAGERNSIRVVLLNLGACVSASGADAVVHDTALAVRSKTSVAFGAALLTERNSLKAMLLILGTTTTVEPLRPPTWPRNGSSARVAMRSHSCHLDLLGGRCIVPLAATFNACVYIRYPGVYIRNFVVAHTDSRPVRYILDSREPGRVEYIRYIRIESGPRSPKLALLWESS